MQWEETGKKGGPVIVLLHGGGLGPYMWRTTAAALGGQYHILLVTLSGHAEDWQTPFVSIEREAELLIDYLDTNFSGKVHVLCGLSIGAQIVIEVLSRRPAIAKKAVIESAMVHPSSYLAAFSQKAVSTSYPLAQKRWFAKAQAKQMYISDALFEEYFRNSARITRESLVQMTVASAQYVLPPSFGETNAAVLVVVGGKEYQSMISSASHIAAKAGAAPREIPGCRHGFSVKDPVGYTQMLQHFLRAKRGEKAK